MSETRIGELEEAIRDAWEGLTRIRRLLDQDNTLVGMPPPYWHPGPLGVGVVTSAYMDERLTRLLAVVGELYVRWEPGAESPEERAIYHEAARLLFQTHPCERCRVFWSDRGYACPEHRVDFMKEAAR